MQSAVRGRAARSSVTGPFAGASKPFTKPKGGARGDDNPVYILDAYMNFAWHDDGKTFLQGVWGPVSKAINFTLTKSEQYGLTYRMVNTNDEHGVIGDVNAYNAFAFLACVFGVAAAVAAAVRYVLIWRTDTVAQLRGCRLAGEARGTSASGSSAACSSSLRRLSTSARE